MNDADGNSYSNWGEALRGYQADKSHLPWKSVEQKPVHHVTKYEKSREERLYDPILGKFRDSGKEETYQKSIEKKVVMDLNEAKDRQLQYSQKFNIINHSSYLYGRSNENNSTQATRKPKKVNTKVGYNIINNQNYSDDKNSTKVHQNTHRGKLILKQSSRHEFSIISNKYKKDHDRRQFDEKINELSKASEKYRKTHDYNLVLAKYYDKDKEKEYSEDEKTKSLLHGTTYITKLPLHHQQSEGVCYNVISNDVIDEKRFQKLKHSKPNKGIKMISKQIDDAIHLKSAIQEKLAHDRSIHRIPYVRLAEDYHHGYDVITNESYIGCHRRDIGAIVAALPPQPPTKWSKINQQQQQGSIASLPQSQHQKTKILQNKPILQNMVFPSPLKKTIVQKKVFDNRMNETFLQPSSSDTALKNTPHFCVLPQPTVLPSKETKLEKETFDRKSFNVQQNSVSSKLVSPSRNDTILVRSGGF